MNNRRAQATLEFTFAIVVIALLIFGLIKIFQWVGMDYAQKSWERQETTIFKPWTATIDEDSTRTKRLVAYPHNF